MEKYTRYIIEMSKNLKQFLMQDLRKCKKCSLPETYETIEYDEKDICNLCHDAEYKNTKIDWNERKKL